MKKLQNNFTTPEQSKRLLALGVPADSADCYHDLSPSLNRRGILSINGVYSSDVPYNHLFSDGTYRFLPCWSVGRLIEIYDICREYDGDYDEVSGRPTYIETYINAIEEALLDRMFDFSKLEE